MRAAIVLIAGIVCVGILFSLVSKPTPATIDAAILSLDQLSLEPGIKRARWCIREYGRDAVWRRFQQLDVSSQAAKYIAMSGLLDGDTRYRSMVKRIAEGGEPERAFALGVLHARDGDAKALPEAATGVIQDRK